MTPELSTPPRRPTPQWANPRARLIASAAILALCLFGAVYYGRWSAAAKQPGAGEADRQNLIGRHIWRKMERAEMEKALQHFQKAAELDPRSASAFSGIADTYVMMSTLGVGLPRNNFSRAREAASRALELDSDLPAPHVVLPTSAPWPTSILRVPNGITGEPFAWTPIP